MDFTMPLEGKRSARRAAIVAVAAAAALLLIAAGFLLASAVGGPALDTRGEVAVPYDAGTVEEVRVLDSLTVYVDGEPKPGPSVMGGIALLVLATVAFMTAAALRFARARRHLVLVFVLFGAGLGYAGLDELFAIHESIGHNLQFLADVPGVQRPDDLVLALYLVPAAAFAWAFRDVLLGDRFTACALGAGIGLFALSALGDLAGVHAEEYLEVVAGLCIAAGLLRLAYVHLRDNLGPRVLVPADEIRAHRIERPLVPAKSDSVERAGP